MKYTEIIIDLIQTMAGEFYVALATIVTSFIIEKFKLNNSYYGPLNIIILGIFTFNITEYFSNEYIYLISYGVYMIIVCMIMYIIKNVNMIGYKIKQFINRNNLETIEIENTHHAMICLAYIEKFILNHKNFKIPPFKYDKPLISYMSFMPIIDTIYEFYDKEKNIRGTIMWTHGDDGYCQDNKSANEKFLEKTVIKSVIVKISITKQNNISLKEYMKCIREEDDKSCESDLTIFSFRMLLKYDDNKKSHTWSRQLLHTYQKNINEPIDAMANFYHHDKKNIIDRINKFQHKTENGFDIGDCYQYGMIIHGPPGTGKSSFVYRLAIHLKRNIVLINLETISRVVLYKLMESRYIDEGNECMVIRPSTSIYAFDEFDDSLKVICEREEKSKELKKKISMIKNNGTYNDDEKKLENELVKSYNELENLVTMKDLLEVFQGIVPIKGAIFIATTNHYGKIKETNPALFRAGRLIPTSYDYFNDDMIKIICKEKYDRKYKSSNENKKYKNVEVMELVQHCTYDEFIAKLPNTIINL